MDKESGVWWMDKETGCTVSVSMDKETGCTIQPGCIWRLEVSWLACVAHNAPLITSMKVGGSRCTRNGIKEAMASCDSGRCFLHRSPADGH